MHMYIAHENYVCSNCGWSLLIMRLSAAMAVSVYGGLQVAIV